MEALMIIVKYVIRFLDAIISFIITPIEYGETEEEEAQVRTP